MKYSKEEIIEKLKNIDGWYLENNSIKKKFKTNSFPETLGLVTAIGALCQQFDHHPDYLTMKYAEIEVSFSTHSAGGVSEKDFEIAKHINLLKFN